MCVSIKNIELIRTLRKYVTPNKEGIQRERYSERILKLSPYLI